MILALKDDNGVWLESTQEIGVYLTTKYLELFKAEPITFCDCLDDHIQEGVSEANNSRIDAIPSTVEIHNIVKSMQPIKAPRLDGMLALFFQKYWSTIGNEVISMIQNAFHSVRRRSTGHTWFSSQNQNKPQASIN